MRRKNLKKGPTKILVADDDVMVRTTVSKILEMFGHLVLTASGGKEVVDMVDDSYDVIILDINMPDMDGFATMDKLNERNYDIPVLFLTGGGSMDYAVKAINLGAYDFLTKPIEDLDIFNVKIRRAIEKRRYVLQERHYKAALEDDIVVDSYDAMTSKRNYRKNLSQREAVEELYRCGGTQFDGDIVEFFARSIVNFIPTKGVFTQEHLENVYLKNQ